MIKNTQRSAGGVKLRERRLQEGLTQKGLAAALGRHHSAISNIERGAYQGDIPLWRDIAQFFGEEITYFVNPKERPRAVAENARARVMKDEEVPESLREFAQEGAFLKITPDEWDLLKCMAKWRRSSEITSVQWTMVLTRLRGVIFPHLGTRKRGGEESHWLGGLLQEPQMEMIFPPKPIAINGVPVQQDDDESLDADTLEADGELEEVSENPDDSSTEAPITLGAGTQMEVVIYPTRVEGSAHKKK